ncbi:MAG: carboxypeptidase-like regulatory domain-containing protein [Planctomycetota bacterium]
MPTVTGVVTLDGEPVASATVTFHARFGRGGTGVTDRRGRYKIHYAPHQPGLPEGEYTVTLSTWRPQQPPRGRDTEGLPEIAERFPAKYSSRSESVLEGTVKPGKNAIDFTLELSSAGPSNAAFR